MKKLDNLQKGIFEVKAMIQSDEDIRKMVYYDSPDALEKTAPSFIQVKDNFTVSPVYDATKPPFNKNTIISFSIRRIIEEDEATLLRGYLQISILTQSNLWELNNNKIRPMHISSLIIDKLNNKKISTSHKIFFTTAEIAILNENINGYTLTFMIEEGAGLEEEF